MTKTLGAGIAALGLAAIMIGVPASAADIYQRDVGPSLNDTAAPAPIWQGVYLGAHLGGAWGDVATTGIPGVAEAKQAPEGVFGGGQLGYNFQRGRVIFGPEVDLGGMDLGGHKLAAGTTSVKSSGGLYGDITGRAGFATDRALVYAKGGFAWFDGSVRAAGTGVRAASSTDTFTGWAAGAGVEYMIRPNWSLKAEYMHFDFGSQGSSFTTTAAVNADHNLTADTVKAGVNYHLAPKWGEPLK
jgi:outer membrane immunogenic protein